MTCVQVALYAVALKPKIHRLYAQIEALTQGAASPLIKLYLRHLANAGRSPRTLKNYSIALTHFFGYFDGREPAAITTDDLDEFFAAERKHLATASVNLTRAAVRGFYKYLLDSEKIVKDPSRLIRDEKIVRTSPAIFSEAQREALLNALDSAAGRRSGFAAMRDRMMILLAFNTGLRVGELVGLNIPDVDGRTTLEIIGKGRRVRRIPLNRRAQGALKDYLVWRKALGSKERTALFVSRLGRRISVRSVQAQLKYWLRQAHIATDFWPHIMRHTFGTEIYRRTRDLRTAQDLLGHSSPSTTKMYTHIVDKDLRNAVETLD